ncbi:MAG: SidA/IucD/PvdA family monooxygenase [Pseudomonadota bacterium]|nr:SidA/IucD/PvdA family monooxygenase [Pseudomonadota bacterium]
MIKTSGLLKLEKRIAHDLSIISYPVNGWIPSKFDEQGKRVLDVLVVGGGQGGLAIAFQLLRERVQNIQVIDAAEAGQEGPWLNYARMPTLRSPKEVNGPDLNIPSLTFQAWYEALFGKLSWKKLNKIPTGLWVNYLKWFRKVLSLPVQNRMRLIAFEPLQDNIKVKIECLTTGNVKEEITRKLILATGIETPGKWSVPPIAQKIPKDFWFHTSEMINFDLFENKEIAVLGAGASAMDNAVMALEAKALGVTLYCRRSELQRVQPFKWLSFPGFLRHFSELNNEWRWKFMSYLLTLREAFPKETWDRANRFEEFNIQTGADWEDLHLKDEKSLS